MAIALLLSVLLVQGGNAGNAGQAGLAAAGRRVYEARKCATCHMIEGHGNIRYKLDGVGAKLAEADLRRWLTDASAMERAQPAQPAVRMSEWLKSNKKLSDADIDALVAYLATLK